MSGPQIFARRVRPAIHDHVFDHPDHEVGGVLVGRLGGGSIPAVTGFIPALEAEGRRASVTFTHEAWATIYATLEERFTDEEIVGWYHSHPGFGIFLSSLDTFIHRNFFSDRRQIAYVVDPQAGTEGVFVWQGEELALLYEIDTERAGMGAIGAESRAPNPYRRLWSRTATLLIVLVIAVVGVITIGGAGGPRRARDRPHTTRTRSVRPVAKTTGIGQIPTSRAAPRTFSPATPGHAQGSG